MRSLRELAPERAAPLMPHGGLRRSHLAARARRAAEMCVVYALLVLAALIFVVPLWWVVASSFTTPETVWSNVLPFSWRAFWPQTFTLNAYATIFGQGMLQAVQNTLFVGLATVILTLVVSALAGFAFARFEFRGKRFLFWLVLLSFIVPGDITIIPSYILVNQLGWLNSWQGLIVPAVANSVVIFLFQQFFSEIPEALIDAARVDGASWLRILVQIIFPLSLPVFVTAGILVFLGQWNNYFWPTLIAPDPAYRVVQVAIAQIGHAQQLTFWDKIFAGSTIAALIPILLTVPLQRYYVRSVMSSGIQG